MGHERWRKEEAQWTRESCLLKRVRRRAGVPERIEKLFKTRPEKHHVEVRKDRHSHAGVEKVLKKGNRQTDSRVQTSGQHAGRPPQGTHNDHTKMTSDFGRGYRDSVET